MDTSIFCYKWCSNGKTETWTEIESEKAKSIETETKIWTEITKTENQKTELKLIWFPVFTFWLELDVMSLLFLKFLHNNYHDFDHVEILEKEALKYHFESETGMLKLYWNWNQDWNWTKKNWKPETEIISLSIA